MEEQKEGNLKISHRNLPHWKLDGSVYFITFNTWEYIRQNPVKAGLSATPEEYPFFWQESQPNQSF